MKVLVIAPWVPSPRRPRSLGLVRTMAGRDEVMVVAAAWSDSEARDARYLRELGIDVQIVRLSPRLAALRALAGIARGKSFQQSYTDSRKFRSAIRRAFSDFAPDLTFFNVLRSAHMASEVSGPISIDLDEFRSSYYKQLSRKSKNPAWKVVGRLESRAMRVAETKVLRDFDTVIVSSPHDLVEGSGQVRLVRSPHVLTVGREQIASETHRIVFVGRLSYRANVEGLVNFVENVLPRVVAQVPTATLDVVGADPDKSVLRLASAHVNIIGAVDDVAPYYSRSVVSVVPIEMATGVQMKLIESLALGVPTVSSEVAANSAGVRDGVDCLVASRPDEWATAVVRLLRDEDLRSRLRAGGQAWAAINYSSQTIRRQLFDAIDGVVIVDAKAP